MAKVSYKTEDQVRDGAKITLGFDKTEAKVQQGTGQITTFNQLGFKGVIDKPDGWYLPDDLNAPAIILETKSEAEDISLQKWVDELEKNCNIVLTKYTQVVGILYNGTDVRVFLNNSELSDAASTLQDIDTRDINEYACLFITSCLQPIAEKYSYNYGMFPDLLKEERIKLPANENGEPDYALMEKYMKIVETKAHSVVKVLSVV